MNSLQKLLDFIAHLDEHRIFYHLSCVRPEAIMVEIAVPGERWEVEFFPDGHVEVEVFASRVDIHGEEALQKLFEDHGE